MITSAWNPKRRMVPRWRTLSITLQSQELACPRTTADKSFDGAVSLELQTARERWTLKPSLESAAELLEAAIVAGKHNEGVAAARRVLSLDVNATQLLRKQAGSLLAMTGHADEVAADLMHSPQLTGKVWRQRIRLNVRDALSWVELSLKQVSEGHVKSASRSMRVALQLSPDNRHVVRSASRLHLCLGDPEKAHTLIMRCPSTRTDPWLIAAEIALAETAGRKPRYLKLGFELVERSNHLPRQITELAGALGTTELGAGSRKKAKKLFVRSMADPTGNSLAQAEWATKDIGSELVSTNNLNSVTEADEAKAFHLFRLGKFDEILKACETWATEEPYSIKAFEFGAIIAGNLGEYAKADELARKGLRLHPASAVLLNTRTFCLASTGKIAEAIKTLALVPGENHDKPQASVAIANKGLIAFRSGQPGIGRIYYQTAIESFGRLNLQHSRASAMLYLAQEAILSGLPDALELFKSAKFACEKSNAQESMPLLRRVEAMIGAVTVDGVQHHL